MVTGLLHFLIDALNFSIWCFFRSKDNLADFTTSSQAQFERWTTRTRYVLPRCSELSHDDLNTNDLSLCPFAVVETKRQYVWLSPIAMTLAVKEIDRTSLTLLILQPADPWAYCSTTLVFNLSQSYFPWCNIKSVRFRQSYKGQILLLITQDSISIKIWIQAAHLQ